MTCVYTVVVEGVPARAPGLLYIISGSKSKAANQCITMYLYKGLGKPTIHMRVEIRHIMRLMNKAESLIIMSLFQKLDHNSLI